MSDGFSEKNYPWVKNGEVSPRDVVLLASRLEWMGQKSELCVCQNGPDPKVTKAQELRKRASSWYPFQVEF